MTFDYSLKNTVEWIVEGPIKIIRLSSLPGDSNLAQLEFLDANGNNVDRREYMLRHGMNGQIAPYFDNRYILDYRNNYSLSSRNGVVFVLTHQKIQNIECHGVEYRTHRRY